MREALWSYYEVIRTSLVEILRSLNEDRVEIKALLRIEQSKM